jgi:acyl-CoA synthetase (AMP-forming)/AMP-acid ligase II
MYNDLNMGFGMKVGEVSSAESSSAVSNAGPNLQGSISSRPSVTDLYAQTFFEPGLGRAATVTELSRTGTLSRIKTHEEILVSASVLAAEMLRLGWRGRRVLLCLRNGIEFIEFIAACLLANVIVVPVSVARSKAQQERLRLVARDADVCATILDSPATASVLLEIGERRVATLEDLRQGVLSPLSGPPAAVTDIAFVQYTSGSTSDPKGVIITRKSLEFNVDLMTKHCRYAAGDIALTWLPMFHDFGLVGFVYAPLRYGINLVCLDPFAFVQKPVRWLNAISEYKATITGAPNFAYKLVSGQVSHEDLAGIDLSPWRVAFNGAEPISKRVTDSFCEKLVPAGFDPRAMMPCYGLAEATLLVTGASTGEGYRAARPSGAHADANINDVVSCGRLLEGVPLRIVNPKSQVVLAEGEVGEILVGGPGIFNGYLGRTKADSSKIKLNNEDYFKTGDLGYVEAGELYVLGRLKDTINLRGRNIYPNVIEDLVGAEVGSDRPNSVVAFGIFKEGSEAVVLLVESTFQRAKQQVIAALESRIRKIVMDTLQVLVSDVVLVKPNRLLKTSSGKLRRSACRALYLSEGFNECRVGEEI